MNEYENLHKSISSLIDEQVFPDDPAKNLFSKWCEVTVGMLVEYVPRNQDLDVTDNILINNISPSIKSISIPDDLQLWEVVPLIKKVSEATSDQSEKIEIKSNEIIEVGNKFQNFGLYLWEYRDVAIPNGTDLTPIALQFIQYGTSLNNRMPTDLLNEEEKIAVEKWALGEKIYNNRLARLGESPTKELIESIRIKTIKNYFSAINKSEPNQNDHPSRFQEQAHNGLVTSIRSPEKILNKHLLDIGSDKAAQNISAVNWKTGINQRLEKLEKFQNFKFESDQIYDSLNIPQLIHELNIIKKSQDLELISEKEIEIAKKIQMQIHALPYNNVDTDENGSFPTAMIKRNYANCIGSSVLFESILTTMGIKSYYISSSGHMFNILRTSDHKLFDIDAMTRPNNDMPFQEMTNDKTDTEETLIQILDNPQFISHQLRFKSAQGKLSQPFEISDPQKGAITKIQLKLADYLIQHPKSDIDLETGKLILDNIIKENPNNAKAYYHLGLYYNKKSDKYNELIAHQTAFNLSPKDTSFIYYYASCLAENGDLDKSRELYLEFLEKCYENPNSIGNFIRFINKNQIKVNDQEKHFVELGLAESNYRFKNTMKMLDYYADNNDMEAAFRLADTAYEKTSRLDYKFYKAYIFQLNGNFSDAFDIYEDLFKSGFNKIRLYNAMSKTSFKAGNNDKWVEFSKKTFDLVSKAKDLDSDERLAIEINYYLALIGSKKIDKVINTIDEKFKQNPQRIELMFSLGKQLFETQNYTDAYYFLEKYVEAKQFQNEGYVNKAMELIKQIRYQKIHESTK